MQLKQTLKHETVFSTFIMTQNHICLLFTCNSSYCCSAS